MAIDPFRLKSANNEPWMQIGFTLFASDNRDDDRLLSALRDRLAQGGLETLSLPKDHQLDTFVIEGKGGEPAAPHGERHTNMRFERKSVRELYVTDTQRRKYPILNDGSIPDELRDNFEFVSAAVTIFEPLKSIPTISSMVRSVEAWGKWFDNEFGILTATISPINQ